MTEGFAGELNLEFKHKRFIMKINHFGSLRTRENVLYGELMLLLRENEFIFGMAFMLLTATYKMKILLTQLVYV
jgi:hypothetical protein